MKELQEEQEIRDSNQDDLKGDHDGSFIDKLIISEDNNFLYAWQIFIALLSLYSVLMNGYYGAFGFPVHYHIAVLNKCSTNSDACAYIWSDILVEFCFLIDIIINFFIEFKSEEKL